MRVRDLAGLLAVLTMLALTSPGVRAVRAAPPERASSESAAQCGAASLEPGAADPELQGFLAELRREQLARVAAGNPGIVMLNGRGYNYGPPPQVDLEMLGRIRAETAGHRR